MLAGLGATAPWGFRAPGYTLSPALLQALVARGYAYDASIFPAAPVLGGQGRGAGVDAAPPPAVGGHPRHAPGTSRSPDALPAGPGRPERRGEAPLVELPMSVTPGARLPFIGTFVVRAPWPLVRSAYLSLRGEPFLSLELHAVDLLGPEDGLPASLVAAQGDLRLPLACKLDRLRAGAGLDRLGTSAAPRSSRSPGRCPPRGGSRRAGRRE